ncbi:hypothetical protein [Corynebacterium lubricantis]|uniref:phosphotriesterase family protein n=1 Tax=Corynebacterium lubricantis TaxID=541095 RepID=UPI0003604D11|nr:hypothetical protein [Corynebacterium lubricantis]
MTDPHSPTVNTVLGPVPADSLGVTAVHESLLSVYPGAEYGYDITIDRAANFSVLKTKLEDFKAAGGGTIVDSTGMFHGRDVHLYEVLAESTGVNIIASTGMGPEAKLGGYFLTPQTNPPTPWPAEKFADLFGKEVTEGVVVPRVERRAPAGLITTTVTATGATPTDESLLRGAARAALATDTALSFRAGAAPLDELKIALDEGINPARVLVGGISNSEDFSAIAEAGSFVAVDTIGQGDDAERLEIVEKLIAAGHASRLLLSAGAIGVAVAHDAPTSQYTDVLESFIPALQERGLSEADQHTILVDNPRRLLTGK